MELTGLVPTAPMRNIALLGDSGRCVGDGEWMKIIKRGLSDLIFDLDRFRHVLERVVEVYQPMVGIWSTQPPTKARTTDDALEERANTIQWRHWKNIRIIAAAQG